LQHGTGAGAQLLGVAVDEEDAFPAETWARRRNPEAKVLGTG
jgi:hypothetical protein